VHCIDDKPNGIILNHNGDWSGEVRIAWYVASERRDPDVPQFSGGGLVIQGPRPPSLQECWCAGKDLVAGRFTSMSSTSEPPPGGVTVPEPPVNVLTRAVALAVESYLRSKLESAVDDLFIPRGKL